MKSITNFNLLANRTNLLTLLPDEVGVHLLWHILQLPMVEVFQKEKLLLGSLATPIPSE